ncbi:MAG: enolase [Candidatus Diapherotrites archaeon]|nr:enolase [Candidatus Diapherotrites archaeon]MDN5366705.1 enolase [Candidatus Diapherotrites archaeon]
MGMKIQDAKVRIVLNSKAQPTLEVIFRGAGWRVEASSPSGTSAGSHEAQAWPRAKTVDEAVRKSAEILVRDVFPEIVGKDLEPAEVDELLEKIDGTERFERIGGNAALAVSIAAVKGFAWENELEYFEAVAEAYGFEPRPVKPLENFIGGGAHGGATDIQEFLMALNAEDMRENILVLSWAYRELKEMLKERDPRFEGTLTLESAYVTYLSTDGILETLGIMRDILHDAGYEAALGIDAAANEMWDGEKYVWRKEGVERTTEEQAALMETLAERYELAYMEDPFHEDAFDEFKALQSKVRTVITGDDLFVTNAKRIERGKGIKGALIKLNQAGSVSRTVEAVKAARRQEMVVTVSHRSGETDDPFLSHFAVGVGADYAKIGAAGIRIVKLNELLRISELL